MSNTGNTENLKKRTMTKDEEDELLERLYANHEDESSDDELPYGGKVYLARRHKPDGWLCIGLQIVLVIGVISLCYYAYYYFEHMHVNVLHGYANLGYDHAQHELGNRYLHGVGVERQPEKAMEWFKLAAEQGHPHASYNLAIGHLKGMHNHLNQSEAKRLIKHAADNEVKEAKLTLDTLCANENCD